MQLLKNCEIHAHALFCIAVMIAFLSAPADALTDNRSAQNNETKQSAASGFTFVKFYQEFLSRADGQRCPMYPSCSHYAQTALIEHGLIKGWVLTCDRLLRCGRDETRLSPTVRINGRPHTYDPLAANTFWWKKP